MSLDLESILLVNPSKRAIKRISLARAYWVTGKAADQIRSFSFAKFFPRVLVPRFIEVQIGNR